MPFKKSPALAGRDKRVGRLKCQAIRVRRNRVEQCSDEAVFDDLCVFHYILARRVTERHLRVLQVVSDIGKAKDRATILEFKEVEK